MSEWIKWWESKLAWMLIGVIILAMGLSFLIVYFVPNLWGLLGVIVVCIPAGLAIRKLVYKIIDEWADKLN